VSLRIEGQKQTGQGKITILAPTLRLREGCKHHHPIEGESRGVLRVSRGSIGLVRLLGHAHTKVKGRYPAVAVRDRRGGALKAGPCALHGLVFPRVISPSGGGGKNAGGKKDSVCRAGARRRENGGRLPQNFKKEVFRCTKPRRQKVDKELKTVHAAGRDENRVDGGGKGTVRGLLCRVTEKRQDKNAPYGNPKNRRFIIQGRGGGVDEGIRRPRTRLTQGKRKGTKARKPAGKRTIILLLKLGGGGAITAEST